MMDEKLRQELLRTTHWNDFNKLVRENNLTNDEIDEELGMHYKEIWESNRTPNSSVKNGVHDDVMLKKRKTESS